MKFKKYIPVLALAALMSGCDKDGEMITTTGPGETTLESSAKGDIVLSIEHIKDLALTLYWNENGDLTLSDPLVEAPENAVSNSLQFSTESSFAEYYSTPVEAGVYYMQFTHQELNNIIARLGVPGGETTPLFIRVAASAGPNQTPRYSEPKEFRVTTYYIDMSIGKFLNKDKGETDRILISPNEDGVYTGFIGAGAWENWWLQEGDNTVWGNLGVDGMSFYISSEASSWNFWYPGTSGCYYTTVNTHQGWWSALLVESLEVSGDLSGTMAYNRQANQWTLDVNIPSAGSYNLTVSGEALMYNTDTTADGPGTPQTAAFGGTANALTFGSQPQTVSVDLPAGQTTLILDLNDPHAWTLGAGDAPVGPSTSDFLYFSGLVNWDGFSTTLILTDADNERYGGAHYIDSEWGYRCYRQPEWDPAYITDSGTALSGTLKIAEGNGNIPAPDKGLYTMDFNMKALTYKLTKIKTLSWTGVNDDWSLRPMTQSADNPEVWTLEFEKTANTPWGTKLVVNGDWNLFFGRGDIDGMLYLRTSEKEQGFEGDNALEIGGTYILTVDLGKQTYSFSSK